MTEPSPGRLDGAVAGIWARFREPVLARVDRLEQAAIAVLERRLDDEARRAAEREAHKLAGSVGTFGFAEGSRLAREAEQLLAGPGALGQAEALRLADLAVALRRELSGVPAGASPASAAPASPESPASPSPASPASPRSVADDAGAAADGDDGAGPLLLIADADRETTERLAMEAAGRGMRPVVVHSAADARAAIARERPDAALLDLSLGGEEDGLALLRALAELEPPVPAVVLTRRDAFLDRVEVARLGGRGFLRKPVPPARALDAVQPLLHTPDQPATILAVDDDRAVLQAIHAVLTARGMRVRLLSDPRRFWEALEAVVPDVLLLDVQMPHVDGVELCRVVRNDPRWRTLPIVFLTAQVDSASVQRVFDAGADDFVAKPVLGPELAARIGNRLERVQLQRRLAEADPLTGLANRRGSETALERLLALAARQAEPLAVAVLDLDRFKQVNDRCGHAVGDEVLTRVARLLQKRFRAEDVVARWGGEEFVVGMFGMDKVEGVQRLAETLEQLREETFREPGGDAFRVTFSGGVAEFPGDGRDLHALYRAADRAMYQAKEAGRDRVLPAGWNPARGEGPAGVDVLVVEDDAALARLLQHALETRGYRMRWVDNGEDAVRLLSGASPELRARAVLLDVDLPGMDGHAVLRHLAQAGLTERTRVIMLTVRSHEAEVVRALETGAFDHVQKPFSVPVLLQRVRRALR
ncbi:MAG TPA: response regulator [Longimicrobium sp.]|nr:response regulator [Longimicrobium sp.]